MQHSQTGEGGKLPLRSSSLTQLQVRPGFSASHIQWHRSPPGRDDSVDFNEDVILERKKWTVYAQKKKKISSP